ncbi:MAG: glycosyltransferase family 39 protein, partial [Candidatus Kapaibacterium sp.]
MLPNRTYATDGTNGAAWQWMAVSLGICAVIFACTLTYPFNNDNALYAYMADLALKGHLPYVGSWDQNFPGIILIHALQILVSGHSQFAFHIFDIVLQLIGSVLLIKLGERLYNVRAGILAAILASLYYVQQGLWMSGERDTYVSIMLLAAFWLASDRKKPVLVGSLCALAFLFRPTYATYAVIFFAWFSFANVAARSPRLPAQSREGGGIPPLQLGAFLAGVLFPLVLFAVLYAAIDGLKDLWDAVILFNLKVYGGEGAAFSFWEPVRFYAVSLIAAAFAIWVLWKKERHALYLWAALFAGSVLSLLVLYRHSVYHYHPAMTLFILLSAIGWIRMVDIIARKWKTARLVLPAIVVLYFIFATFRGNTIQHVLVDIANGNIHSVEESYDRYEPSPDFGVRVQTEVGDYLREHTHPNDTVQMFGPYSYPQYRTGLLTASRFQTLHAITMRGAGDTLQTFQYEWRAEYMRDLRRLKPRYFIVCDAPPAFRQYYGGRLGHEILREDFK